jgi:hypothetical protein
MAIQALVPVGLVAAAAAVALAVSGSPLLTGAPDPLRSVKPTPAPTTTEYSAIWPSAVSLDGRTLPLDSITEMPMPQGAGVAATYDARGGRGLLVAAGGAVREVTTKFRIYSPALSPDGRTLAYAYECRNGNCVDVVDLTSGALLFEGNRDGVANDVSVLERGLEWSADGSTLVLNYIALGPGADEQWLRMWQFDGRSLSPSTDLGPLPASSHIGRGPGLSFVGVSPDGTTVAVNDNGMIAMSSTASPRWTTTQLPMSPDHEAAPYGLPLQGYGQNRWSPDGEHMGWAANVGDEASFWGEVRTVDLTRSAWTVHRLGASPAFFIGWRGGDPVLTRSIRGVGIEIFASVGGDREERLSIIDLPSGGGLVSVAQTWLPGSND